MFIIISQLEYKIHSNSKIQANFDLDLIPKSKDFEVIENLFKIEVSYIADRELALIKEKNQKSLQPELATYKRPRFLSEDNCHPSYQVLNFQNMFLQDDYLSNDNQNKYKPAQTQTFNTNTYLKRDSKELKLNTKSFISLKKKSEKDTTNSRRSTDMKSFIKSKQIDSFIEEISNPSFELDIESEEQSDDHQENYKPQLQHPVFNILEVKSKIEKLKSNLYDQ